MTKEPYIVFNLWGQKCWLSWTEFCLLSREKKPRGSRRRGGKENEVRACVCVCVCVYVCVCVCCVHVCIFPPFVHPSRSGRRFGISSYVGHFDHSCYMDVAGAVSNQWLQAVSASAAIRLALCYPYQYCGSMPHLRIYFHTFPIIVLNGLPWWLSSKESTCNAGDAIDAGLIPESGRSPGGGNGNPLQYSCQRNPMDKRSLRGYR